MTPPEPTEALAAFTEAIAAEVRAEMARQRKTQADLAAALGINPATAGKRLNCTAPFNTVELYKVAVWLGVPPEQFYPREVSTGGAA